MFRSPLSSSQEGPSLLEHGACGILGLAGLEKRFDSRFPNSDDIRQVVKPQNITFYLRMNTVDIWISLPPVQKNLLYYIVDLEVLGIFSLNLITADTKVRKVPKGYKKDVEISFNTSGHNKESNEVKVIIASEVFNDTGR